MFESQFRHKQRHPLRVPVLVSIRTFLGAVWFYRFAQGTIASTTQGNSGYEDIRTTTHDQVSRPSGRNVVRFLSPIDTRRSNAVLSATTDTAEVANGI